MASEQEICKIVRDYTQKFANDFAEKHISQLDNDNGIINMKIHNVFIAALGKEIQYYSALARSLDSSLGNMLESMAIEIAKKNYKVSQSVEGKLYTEQTGYIAKLLEGYKNNSHKPKICDYKGKMLDLRGKGISKRHESDYYLYDEDNRKRYLIELKIGGDLDNKKARSEKEALLEQYCILTNTLGTEENVEIKFATAYNRYGEGHQWNQSRVLQFFAPEELCISKDFWNLVTKLDNGFNIVINEYKQNANHIIRALDRIKREYLP